ncbi:sensor histidine kinase [Stigmatella aurantiaca]|uniref:histidine kinase n=1 Tax=Stigmatella aurantiaca (strain DW4/3-1) TaxID=378806 RepID=Q08RE9_STIAD|nr:ATP-binding protein [Stigmatella aurantiaca]ADO70723.1 Sensor protein [Stigmatella aurantiaca DW4/3-1]EAU63063.1 hybrid sensor [Stigmatella aurantiaca DW4/3-1]
MTVRWKVLLIVGLTTGLVLLMGLTLLVSTHRGKVSRDRLLLIQGQGESFGRLHQAAEQYLRNLLRTKEQGGNPAGLQKEMQENISQEEAFLQQATSQEKELGMPDRTEEWAETEAALLNLRLWTIDVAEQVRALPEEAKLLTVEKHLLDEFEQTVGRHITAAQEEEFHERRLQLGRSQSRLNGQKWLALILPTLSCALLLGLVLIILPPMDRALKDLMLAARRIGEGNFEVKLPEDRQDELGTLAHAFNQMASELKKTLEEKQRLMKAEAEVTEQQFRHYNALLEETVLTRTAQLEQANTQLQDSLDQLKAAQSQLIFADRLASMGRLAAGVGHEINNPLSYVLSNLNYLHRELQPDREPLSEEEKREMMDALTSAREGAERVRLIVKDLKTLSRPDDMNTEPVDLSEVVRGAVKLAERELRARARLVEDYGHLPRVKGNPTRLGQVFLNLLINAAHAITQGGKEANEIRILTRLSGPGRVQVEVSDTGCGIAQENLPRIFEPFFTTKPAGEGTGMGLSVCHSIITALGGEFHVESELGRGSTFFILLPVMDDTQPDQTEAAPLWP